MLETLAFEFDVLEILQKIKNCLGYHLFMYLIPLKEDMSISSVRV